MYEVKFPDLRWVNTTDQKFLHALYDNCLYEDKNWHFFWEGGRGLWIRVSNYGNALAVNQFAIDYGIKRVSTPNVYLENIPIALLRYCEQFWQLFHAFSELAIKMERISLACWKE